MNTRLASGYTQLLLPDLFRKVEIVVGGKMKRCDLRRHMGVRYADLDPVLEKKDRIRISGEIIIDLSP